MTEDRPSRRGSRAQRIQHATRLVELAWQDLPAQHRQLLESVGAAQSQVVDGPLGECVAGYLSSAGEPPLASGVRVDLDRAIGVWIPQLRVLLLNAGHPALAELDDTSYEAMLVRAAWHEWGHALSLALATPDDIAAGEHLLSLAPQASPTSSDAEGTVTANTHTNW